VNSVFEFIVTPLTDRYKNTKKIGEVDVIINTNIENFKSVSKLGKVVSVPLVFNQDIKVGDVVCIHHNVFRRWYDVKGKERNSRGYFKKELYFCGMDQVYLYHNGIEWKSFLDRCFVAPLKDEDQKGIIKYGNRLLIKNNINVGDIVSFKPDREFEFILNDQLLYCMKSKDIVIKHENRGNEKVYNPSWTRGSEGINKGSERRNCEHRGRCICGPTKECSCNKEVSYI
jgi:hypothetical protein